ncbi:MAG: hypothetical protein R3B47_17045, partial [Bacteroidia bacterium]
GDLLKSLYSDHGICNLLVEGGSYTLQKLLDEQCVDKLVKIKSPLYLRQGRKAPQVPGHMRPVAGFFMGKDEIVLLNCS